MYSDDIVLLLMNSFFIHGTITILSYNFHYLCCIV